MVKRQLLISFIVLCISCVNVFALGNFIDGQKNHPHEFCALLAHDHHHAHHGTEHTHSHKINFVDFYAASTTDLSVSPVNYGNPFYQKQWLAETHLLQRFRPPIS